MGQEEGWEPGHRRTTRPAGIRRGKKGQIKLWVGDFGCRKFLSRGSRSPRKEEFGQVMMFRADGRSGEQFQAAVLQCGDPGESRQGMEGKNLLEGYF